MVIYKMALYKNVLINVISLDYHHNSLKLVSLFSFHKISHPRSDGE